MDIKIRNATIEDLDRIVYVESVCFPEAEAASSESLTDRITTYPAGFFVATNEDTIVGFINGARTNKLLIEDEFFSSMSNHEENGSSFVIFGLDVLPDYQNRGYARKLMNHLIDYCKSKGMERVVLTCKTHLIKYYESFGFVNDGLSESTHGGAEWYDMTVKL